MQFSSKKEAYRFCAWLEFYIAPKKKMEANKAHDKALIYSRSLMSKAPMPEAIQSLEIFRDWCKQNSDFNFLSLYP